jgi:predicted adenylyl cyclase CyaB
MQNVEFKAELRDLDLARVLCKRVRATFLETLRQTDTYFRLADGRLKRRETAGHPTEYIFYHRENAARARLSRFKIYTQSQALVHFGSLGLPVWTVVHKTREVWMHSGVRIHLDVVDQLGTFLELEALVTDQTPADQCHQTLGLIRQAFSPVLGEILSHSYADMVAADAEPAPGA